MDVNIVQQMSPDEKCRNQESRIEWNKSNSSSVHGSLVNISYIPSSRSLSYSSLYVPNSFHYSACNGFKFSHHSPNPFAQWPRSLPAVPYDGFLWGNIQTGCGMVQHQEACWFESDSNAEVGEPFFFFYSVSFEWGITRRLCPAFPGFWATLFASQGVIKRFVRTLESLWWHS